MTINPDELAKQAFEDEHREKVANARILEAEAKRRELLNKLLPRITKDMSRIAESLEELSELLNRKETSGF